MISRVVPFLIAAAIFALDRITKNLIKGALDAFDTWTVIPGFFNIIHAENRGMAFSLMIGSRFLLVGVATVFLLWLGWMLATSAEHALPLSFLLGGAAGNLFDRYLYGSVTDFLDVYIGDLHWPTFNVADSAITIGAALLLLDLWRSKGRQTSALPQNTHVS